MQTLPPEIWQQVLSFLPEDPERADDDREPLVRYPTLINLCLTSKYLHSIAEPYLYRSFSTSQAIPLLNFAYAVLKNPRLAGHVCELDIDLDRSEDGYINNNPDDKWWMPKTTIMEYHQSKAREYEFTVDHSASDLQMMNDVCIKLLCLKLPNLHRLSLHMSYGSALEKLFVGTAQQTIHTDFVSNLRELYVFDDVETNGHAVGCNVIYVAGLFSLPKLETVVLSNFHHIWDQNYTQHADGSRELEVYQSVKTLRLFDSVLSALEIGRVATAFPHLAVFQYSAGPSEDGPDGFTGNEGIKGLTALAGSLRTLILDLVIYFDERSINRSEDFVRSFKGLEGLENLNVESLLVLQQRPKRVDGDEHSDDTRYECLSEVDGLWKDYFPISLSTLRIARVYRNIEKPLRELSENVKEWLPGLKLVHLGLGCNEGAPGYTDQDVPRGVPMRDYFERVFDDEMLKEKLDREYGDSDKSEIENAHGKKTEIPKQFVVGGDYAKSMENYLIRCVGARHLPDVWRKIIASFNDAGVRVKICPSGFNGPEIDNDEQMVKLSWRLQTHRPPIKY